MLVTVTCPEPAYYSKYNLIISSSRRCYHVTSPRGEYDFGGIMVLVIKVCVNFHVHVRHTARFKKSYSIETSYNVTGITIIIPALILNIHKRHEKI